MEAATELVTREVRRKKAQKAATLQKAIQLATEIEAPTSSLVRADVATDAHQVVRAAEDLQELVTSYAENLLVATSEETTREVQEDKAAGSEAAASEAVTGIPDSPHSNSVIVVESDSTPSSSSHSISSSLSFDLDDVPLGQIYSTIHKGLSPTTKLHKEPSQTTPFKLMIPSVDGWICNLSKMRNRVCEKLPLNHPLQPQIIPPLNMAPPKMNVATTSSSQPPSTNQTQDTSVLDNLVSHYSGELPKARPNLPKASEVTSMEVTLESPPHQEPNLHMASSITLTPNSTNIQSSSNLDIVPTAPPKPTKIPSPPTIFLDSTLLMDVCENIAQELKKLIQARNDLIHKDSYEKQWSRLKERIDYIMYALQTTCCDAQDLAQ